MRIPGSWEDADFFNFKAKPPPRSRRGTATSRPRNAAMWPPRDGRATATGEAAARDRRVPTAAAFSQARRNAEELSVLRRELRLYQAEEAMNDAMLSELTRLREAARHALQAATHRPCSESPPGGQAQPRSSLNRTCPSVPEPCLIPPTRKPPALSPFP